MFEQTENTQRRGLGSRIHQFFCGLTGHNGMKHFSERRMSLVCTDCGHETAGWDLNARPPKKADTKVKMTLVKDRRIA